MEQNKVTLIKGFCQNTTNCLYLADIAVKQLNSTIINTTAFGDTFINSVKAVHADCFNCNMQCEIRCKKCAVMQLMTCPVEAGIKWNAFKEEFCKKITRLVKTEEKIRKSKKTQFILFSRIGSKIAKLLTSKHIIFNIQSCTTTIITSQSKPETVVEQDKSPPISTEQWVKGDLLNSILESVAGCLFGHAKVEANHATDKEENDEGHDDPMNRDKESTERQQGKSTASGSELESRYLKIYSQKRQRKCTSKNVIENEGICRHHINVAHEQIKQDCKCFCGRACILCCTKKAGGDAEGFKIRDLNLTKREMIACKLIKETCNLVIEDYGAPNGYDLYSVKMATVQGQVYPVVSKDQFLFYVERIRKLAIIDRLYYPSHDLRKLVSIFLDAAGHFLTRDIGLDYLQKTVNGFYNLIDHNRLRRLVLYDEKPEEAFENRGEPDDDGTEMKKDVKSAHDWLKVKIEKLIEYSKKTDVHDLKSQICQIINGPTADVRVIKKQQRSKSNGITLATQLLKIGLVLSHLLVTPVAGGGVSFQTMREAQQTTSIANVWLNNPADQVHITIGQGCTNKNYQPLLCCMHGYVPLINKTAYNKLQMSCTLKYDDLCTNRDCLKTTVTYWNDLPFMDHNLRWHSTILNKLLQQRVYSTYERCRHCCEPKQYSSKQRSNLPIVEQEILTGSKRQKRAVQMVEKIIGIEDESEKYHLHKRSSATTSVRIAKISGTSSLAANKNIVLQASDFDESDWDKCDGHFQPVLQCPDGWVHLTKPEHYESQSFAPDLDGPICKKESCIRKHGCELWSEMRFYSENMGLSQHFDLLHDVIQNLETANIKSGKWAEDDVMFKGECEVCFRQAQVNEVSLKGDEKPYRNIPCCDEPEDPGLEFIKKGADQDAIARQEPITEQHINKIVIDTPEPGKAFMRSFLTGVAAELLPKSPLDSGCITDPKYLFHLDLKSGVRLDQLPKSQPFPTGFNQRTALMRIVMDWHDRNYVADSDNKDFCSRLLIVKKHVTEQVARDIFKTLNEREQQKWIAKQQARGTNEPYQPYDPTDRPTVTVYHLDASLLETSDLAKMYRCVADLRWINDLTKKKVSQCPAPWTLLNDAGTMSLLHRKKADKDGDQIFFSSLDITQAYNAIQLTPETSNLLNIITPDFTFIKFIRAPFGIASLGSFFNDILLESLASLRTRNRLLQYADDVNIISPSYSEHVKDLTEVAVALTKLGLKINPLKSKFFRSNLEFLSFNCNSDGFTIAKAKLQALREYQAPKNVKQLQRFLGLANYLAGFVYQFQQTAAPLTDLLRSDVDFIWSKKCQHAFDSIINSICANPKLAFFNPEAELQVYTDASRIAGGCVGYQKDKDGVNIPVLFHSKKWSKKDGQLFSSLELEAAMILNTLDHLKYYINSATDIVIHTDAKAIVYILDAFYKSANVKLERFAAKLLAHDLRFKICYTKPNIPGLVIADALSRQFHPANEDNKGNLDYRIITHEDIEKVGEEGEEVTFNKLCEHVQANPIDFDKVRLRDDKEHGRWPHQKSKVHVRPVQIMDEQVFDHKSNVFIDIAAQAVLRAVYNEPPIAHLKYQRVAVQRLITTQEGELYKTVKCQRIFDKFNYLNTPNIIQAQSEDEKLRPIIDKIRGLADLENGQYKLQGELLCTKKDPMKEWGSTNCLIMLPESLLASVIAYYHLACGHAGSSNLKRMINNYWHYRGLEKKVQDFCKSCYICRLAKHNQGRYKLMPDHATFAKQPGHCLMMDHAYMTPVNGFKFLLVLSDEYSGYCKLVPSRTLGADTVIKALSDYFGTHGAPLIVKSDNHPSLARNRGVRKLLAQWGCQTVNLTIPHAKNHNAKLERKISTVRNIFRCLAVQNGPKSWLALLNWVTFVANSTPMSTHGYSPYELFFNRKPLAYQPAKAQFVGENEAMDELRKNRKLYNNIGKAVLEQQKKKYEAYRKKENKAVSHRLVEGDLVLRANKTGEYVRDTSLAVKYQVRFVPIPHVIRRLRGNLAVIENCLDGKFRWCHANSLKKLHPHSELITKLPDHVKDLLGVGADYNECMGQEDFNKVKERLGTIRGNKSEISNPTEFTGFISETKESVQTKTKSSTKATSTAMTNIRTFISRQKRLRKDTSTKSSTTTSRTATRIAAPTEPELINIMEPNEIEMPKSINEEAKSNTNVVQSNMFQENVDNQNAGLAESDNPIVDHETEPGVPGVDIDPEVDNKIKNILKHIHNTAKKTIADRKKPKPIKTITEHQDLIPKEFQRLRQEKNRLGNRPVKQQKRGARPVVIPLLKKAKVKPRDVAEPSIKNIISDSVQRIRRAPKRFNDYLMGD